MKTNFTFLKIAIRISGLFLVFLFSHVAGQAQYCTPTGDCSWGDNVYDFYTTNGVTDISNMASGCSVNGYGDFTSSDTLIIHQLRSFSVNVQTEGSYSQGFTIWIDWNQDGDFNDAGEEVWNSGSNGTQLFSGTITVPPDAATGNTVMRVMAGYLCVPTDPCNNCSSYGETEDYAVKVLPPLPFIESFETAYMPGYWTNTSASGGPWEIGNESINTPGYDNAIADHTGNSGYYAWMDFSGGDDSVVIESPILDVSSNINVVLSFYEFSYSSSGSANANWLFVECFDGTGWIKIDSILQNDPGWVKYIYNLTPYKYNAGVNLQFRFRAESGGQLYDYYNDILIDYITLFEPTQYDAGIVYIDAPAFSFEPSARDIKVSIENYGAANLTSANINYSINGGTVNTFNWTGSLPLFTKDTGVTIGNHVFPTGLHNIKAWTTSPNGNTDNNNSNDTSSITVITCSSLNGTYTVGGSTANFPDVSAAAFALNQCGISGPVIFDINPGTYTGNFEILPVPGASATNTISFQSATGDSTDVVLQTDNSSPNNWIAHLNGADYITFKQLTFDASTATANGRMIYFSNNANHNTVANCILSGSYQSGTNYAAIYGYDDLNEYNTFINNIIQNCSAGLYWRGTSSLSAGNIISNNQILNYANYGMYLYYQDAIQVTGNTIAGAATHGIYCYYLDNDILISKNDIQNAGLYGIYLYYCDGTSTNRSEVSNNFISNATGSGIYDRYPKYRDYLYNSINVPASNYGLYLYNYTSSYQGHNIFNNNIITSGSGTAIYVDEPSYVNNCDFNNYYSASGDIANFGSTGYSDLASLQAAYPTLNTNCLSVNPQFFSSTNLHIYDFDLDSAATPIAGISTDIDGETRNSTHPDIGADEFTIPPMTITDLYAEHPDTIDVGKGNT
ncbi:MAG: GEVED domain-containing protein, partial [Bacteroidota bacterium]